MVSPLAVNGTTNQTCISMADLDGRPMVSVLLFRQWGLKEMVSEEKLRNGIRPLDILRYVVYLHA
jgi:hypothetical protein